MTVFAALESRANQTVIDRLSNAVATIGGEQVPVIFDTPYMDSFDDQVDACDPECTGASAALAGVVRGDLIRVDGKAYRVHRPEPDGTGLTRLLLQRREDEDQDLDPEDPDAAP